MENYPDSIYCKICGRFQCWHDTTWEIVKVVKDFAILLLAADAVIRLENSWAIKFFFWVFG